MSSRGDRTLSGPWRRLKPVTQDSLEVIGLPSKGDNKLLDYKTQETYYTRVVERYMAFCSDAEHGVELLRRLASASHDNSTEKEISILLLAMRKLREGIVASKRIDDFSIQAYIFSIRLSILVKHTESYHPAILHLLRVMHPVQPLASTELQEFVGYLILDLACRQAKLGQAFLVQHQYRLHDTKINAVLSALTHDNYYVFWRVKQTVDGHKAKIMEFAEYAMRRQTLKCLGRSYLSIDLPFLEESTNSTWSQLTENCGVGWRLEGNKVIIRKHKVHPSSSTQA
ncbi:BgTH12-00071 [Blumeria graminis f. sp. triticale]|uniref:Bgt-2965 n=3 Tax=Blumeria graminis TaxID=34373 RepID=A0A061HCR9_BLUGR|nr:hypothetical protein BGT96224_2965 [Blumeria graminis f. sp. tritici 96224]CAD6504562.1 BgTH12-00071 [Blumeria graminis f. sp. triticale]VDB92543.1 Bgt-2965 [Blumeria graminis f. sp. tritici]